MLHKLKKLQEQVQKLGLVAVLNKARRDHIFSRHHEVVIRLVLAESRLKDSAADNNYQLSVIQSKDDPAMVRAKRDFPDRGREFDNYMDVGCIIFAIERDGRVLGIFLATAQDFYDRNMYRLTFELGPQECYGFSLLVHPEARGQKAAKVLMNEGFKWLIANGQKDILAVCTSEDPLLYRFYMQAGFKPTGKAIDFYRIFHTRWSRWTSHREVLPKQKKA